MRICEKCGNTIPDHGNGVCYTCGRIENENRRYGRRRPQQRPLETEGTSALPEYLRKRIEEANKHKKLSPQRHKLKKKEGQRKAPRKVVHKVHSRHQKTKCPVCEQSLTVDQLDEHLNLNHQKIHVQRIGLNRFMVAIFGSKYLLSDLLKDQGLAKAQISILSDQKNDYIPHLLYSWGQILGKHIPYKQARIIVACYGWEGYFKAFSEIGRDVGLSFEQVKEQHAAALVYLQQPKVRGLLRGEAVRIAKIQLGS